MSSARLESIKSLEVEVFEYSNDFEQDLGIIKEHIKNFVSKGMKKRKKTLNIYSDE